MDINVEELLKQVNTGPVKLFPVPVFVYKLPVGITQQEMSFVKGLTKQYNNTNHISENLNILEYNELSRIRDFCNECFQDAFIKYMAPGEDVSIYITQSWANYAELGESHFQHRHPNSYLSGVFYAQTTPDDKIYFLNPHSHFDCLQLKPREWNEWNSRNWWLEAETNSLIIFPSWLLHEVGPNISTTTRISIAVNSFLRGAIGYPSDANYLNLY